MPSNSSYTTYKLDSLAEIMAQVVKFGLDEFDGGEFCIVPEAVTNTIAYTVACFAAQHTKGGDRGIETSEAYLALQVNVPMPYAKRVILARAFINELGGEK